MIGALEATPAPAPVMGVLYQTSHVRFGQLSFLDGERLMLSYKTSTYDGQRHSNQYHVQQLSFADPDQPQLSAPVQNMYEPAPEGTVRVTES